MTWVKLDDGFPDHPKVLAAGPEASWFYVCGLAYCNRHLTDGRIPAAILSRLADVSHPVRLANKLVSVGLWECFSDGSGDYLIHDYHSENDTAEKVKAKRAATRARVKAWREKRDGNAVTSVTCNAVTNEAVTLPATATATATATDISKETSATLIESPRVPRFDLDAVYARYPRKEGKAAGMARLKSRIKTQGDYEAFSQAVDNYAAKIKREATEKRFILQWGTFAGGRWQDYATGAPALAIDASPPNGAPSEPGRASHRPLPRYSRPDDTP